MPDFTPPEKKNGKGEDPIFPLIPIPEKIVEPRCNVCKSDFRDAIDRQLAMGRSNSEIVRTFSTDKQKFDHRSVANHAKEHLGYEDAAVRELVERDAQNHEENMEKGISAALQRRALLDAIVQKGHQKVVDGTIELELKDIVKAVELRDKLEKDSVTAAIEGLMIQFHAFREAVLEEVPQEYYTKVLNRAKKIAQAASKGEVPTEPPELNP